MRLLDADRIGRGREHDGSVAVHADVSPTNRRRPLTCAVARPRRETTVVAQCRSGKNRYGTQPATLISSLSRRAGGATAAGMGAWPEPDASGGGRSKSWRRAVGGRVSEVRTRDGLALLSATLSSAAPSATAAAAAAGNGDDAPRLIIPLVRIADPPEAPAVRTARHRRANDSKPTDGQVDAREPAAYDEPVVDPATGVAARPSEVALAWARLAAGSADLVVALDGGGRVLAVSPSAAQLIAGPGGDRVAGRHLLDVLDLVDFNPTPGDASMYADRIPPLLAIASNALSRGLLRVRTRGRTVTLDAVAAPLHDASGALVGAVCFLTSLTG
jgi:PAS domain-containing protein